MTQAKEYAINAHQSVNHKYDGKPYEVHLKLVHEVAFTFLGLIPVEDQQTVLAACWLHDTIEDCRLTYNDIKSKFGEKVAEIVYAVTNEKGRTRKDRANSVYYYGIKHCQYATFVKVCDRIANVQYSKDNKSGMFEKYKKENTEFQAHLHCSPYEPMFNHLRALLI